MKDYSYSAALEKSSSATLLDECDLELNSGYFALKHEPCPVRDEVVVIKGKVIISL